MPVHEIFFYGGLFFLIGILLGSIGLGFVVPWLVGGCFVFGFAIYFWKKRSIVIWIAGLSLLALLGTIYFYRDDQIFRRASISEKRTMQFEGIVANDPVQKENYQEFVIKITSPNPMRVLIRTSPFPEYVYGDVVRGSGAFSVPTSESYAKYLSKERISAFGYYPELQKIAYDAGSPIYGMLYRIKHAMTDSVFGLIPAKEAALLNGLLLGDTHAFSKEFSEAMKQSGTTHLVALSGYNITILLWAVISICTFFVSRRVSVVVAFVAMIGFVLMTGAEASVVRAAIMSSIVLLAGEVGRSNDTRNAILFAALLMALWNPKVLAFDVGFQLSFFALLGLVYLKPALEAIWNRKKKKRISSLSENIATTLAAQFAVLPILLGQFGVVSLVGIVSNVLILELVPLTMGLGFLTAGIGIFWHTIATPLSWILWVFLRFQTMVIEWFGGLNWNLKANGGPIWAALYYAALVGIIFYAKKFISKTDSA